MLKPRLSKFKHKPLQNPSTLENPSPTSSLKTHTHILILLKQCKSIRSVKQIHAQLLANSLNHPNHLLSKLIDLQDLHYSTLFFSQIPRPNEFSFNIMIRAMTTFWGNYPLAFEFYVKMTRCCVKPDNYTYPFVLKAIGCLQSLHSGQMTHGSIFRLGLDLDLHTAHSLITMYLKCGELGSARKVFDEITDKDLVSWNSMISGYVGMGFAREAVELFKRMREEGFEACERTFASVLKACGSLGDRELGKELERLIEETGMEMGSFLGSALVNLHGKCGDLKSARKVFDGMKQSELAVWNSMLAGQV